MSNNMKKITPKVPWTEITPGGDIYAAGNSKEFITGDWSSVKPVYLIENCRQCLLCVPVCPDSAIPVKDGKRTGFDFDHCKGCGVCVKACHFDAIEINMS